VADVTSYLEAIFNFAKNSSSHLRCYRGQANKGWDLKPTVMRGDLVDNAESQVISELMLETPDEFQNDRSMFDKLVRARHYGLPTRLLDVSLNPLPALFFACSSKEEMNSDASVMVLDFERTRVKFADSDTVSLISNLSRLSDDERKSLLVEFEKFKKNREQDLADAQNKFRDSDAIKRLNHFVREEKPYFQNLIDPNDLFKYFFVYPRKNNRRLISQSGAFVAAGMLQFKVSSTKIEKSIIHIPASSKKKIISQLDILNINSRTMYPEIGSISSYISDKWKST
jgi:hypothetical protein